MLSINNEVPNERRGGALILVDTRGDIVITDMGTDLIKAKRLLLSFSPEARWNDLADFEDIVSEKN